MPMTHHTRGKEETESSKSFTSSLWPLRPSEVVNCFSWPVWRANTCRLTFCCFYGATLKKNAVILNCSDAASVWTSWHLLRTTVVPGHTNHQCTESKLATWLLKNGGGLGIIWQSLDGTGTLLFPTDFTAASIFIMVPSSCCPLAIMSPSE